MWFKYSPSTLLKEKEAVGGKSTKSNNHQIQLVGETLLKHSNIDVRNKSCSGKITKSISHLAKPVSRTVIHKAMSSLKVSNLHVKKSFPINCTTKGGKTSEIIETGKAFDQLNKIKLPKLPPLKKHCAFDVRRKNEKELDIPLQPTYSNKHSTAKLKCNRQTLYNKNDSEIQFNSNLTRKRFISDKLDESKADLLAANQPKIQKLAYQNSSKYNIHQKLIEKNRKKSGQNSLILKNGGKPAQGKNKANVPKDISSYTSVNKMLIKLWDIEPVGRKNNSSNYIDGLKQKNTSINGKLAHHNHFLKRLRPPRVKNEFNCDIGSSISNFNTPVIADQNTPSVSANKNLRKVNIATHTFKTPVIADQNTPSVSANKNLRKVNIATHTDNQLNAIRESRKPLNKHRINPAQCLNKQFLSISYDDNSKLQKTKEEFVQPVHLRFNKPKNTELCKMRRLYNPSMAGYNCYRSDFAVEYDNEAEQVLGVAGQLNELRLHSEINIGNRLLNNTEEVFNDDELLESLELALVEGYNSRLQERERRKRIIKEFGILNQKAIVMWHNKFEASLGKVEFKKLVRFIQFQTFTEAGMVFASLELMYEKRAEINKMIFYRSQRGISSHTDMNIFENLRHKMEPKLQRTDINNVSYARSSVEVCPKPRNRKSSVDLCGMPRYRELSNLEVELCTTTRLTPEFFLDAKATLIAECKKHDGILLKKARKLFRKDVNKTRKIFNLLLEQGLIWLPDPAKN